MARKKKPGPKSDKLKLDGDWEEQIGKAMKKKRPKDWPEEDKGKKGKAR